MEYSYFIELDVGFIFSIINEMVEMRMYTCINIYFWTISIQNLQLPRPHMEFIRSSETKS